MSKLTNHLSDDVKNRLQKAKVFGKKVSATATTVAIVGLSAYAPSAMAAASSDYDTSVVTTEMGKGKAPINTVAGASLGLFVTIRVWKLIRKAI